MRFEVFDREGNILFWTEHFSCLPKPDEIKLMKDYKFKLDGKLISSAKLLEKLAIPEITIGKGSKK